ncbi:hypothetical protein OS493_040196 [Desmophyllum pertusum]|uniref:Uncharacterized protein n=1 Tax=Desmophyllum pertusum TaxID=174260 RepID=A0A9W9Y9N2_9CNID|nr:hypothetical protein OS493_040196 [Desmophyllum pertusum]
MFASVVIPPEKLKQLQVNLIRSHAAGVGHPLSVKHTRMLFALRINILAKGYRDLAAGLNGPNSINNFFLAAEVKSEVTIFVKFNRFYKKLLTQHSVQSRMYGN